MLFHYVIFLLPNWNKHTFEVMYLEEMPEGNKCMEAINPIALKGSCTANSDILYSQSYLELFGFMGAETCSCARNME